MTSIIDAIDDPNLLRPAFVREGRGSMETWKPWRVVLKALFALPMDESELALFKELTGRDTPPAEAVNEAWFIVGRRGGKTFISAAIAVYLACFKDYTKHLAPGEVATVMLLAADRKQASQLLNYVRGILHCNPMLEKMIVTDNSASIQLVGRVVIEVHTASFRAVRGYTVAGAIGDEIAFWRSEDSANPDFEILAALRPAMATIPGAMLLGISSPYRRGGALWEAFRDHYGKESRVLVVRAGSMALNPTLPQHVVDAAYARDPASAAAEYGAEFRSDIAGFLDSAWIDRAATLPLGELPLVAGTKYFGFIDPSGGGSDSMTLGIAHREGERVVLDVIRGRRPPFAPDSVVEEFCAILGRYGLKTATSDRYGGEWVTASFGKHGVRLLPSEKSKSDIYLETEPLFAQGQVSLPDHDRLILELRQLERRTSRSGKDSVDHPGKAHDDYANAACGALWLASLAIKPQIEPRIRRL